MRFIYLLLSILLAPRGWRQPDLLEAGRVQRVNKQRRGDFNFVGGDVLSGGE
jgi:hypothetical protein